ncbi:hypothetical protein Mapa_007043 [Marchantia paleacea]|nr:hypothetical protein Mapa_007043 [Marchantia paleacea]
MLLGDVILDLVVLDLLCLGLLLMLSGFRFLLSSFVVSHHLIGLSSQQSSCEIQFRLYWKSLCRQPRRSYKMKKTVIKEGWTGTLTDSISIKV